MPLNPGQQYAIYLLLAQQPKTTSGDSKSALRLAVEQAAGPNASPAQLQKALQDTLLSSVDESIDASAIGPFQLDDAASIRSALSMAYSGPGCPGLSRTTDIYDALKSGVPV